MKKILLVVLPALLLVLTGCIGSGTNTRSYNEMVGTFVIRQSIPMICIDGGLYIHEASMYSYEAKKIKVGQRLKSSFTIDLNNQPENLINQGCYQVSGLSIGELPSYPVTDDLSDKESYPESIDGVNAYGLYHQIELDSYLLTILGQSSGTEQDFKLYYLETSKLNSNVDTLKFEMGHKKKAGISNQAFYATFDIKYYKDQLSTPEKYSIVQIKFKKEGSDKPVLLNIPYTHPANIK